MSGRSQSSAPTPASTVRRGFAERIASVYAADSAVAAVLVGGSTARGHADRFSDLELFVVWNAPPVEADRFAAIEAAGGDLVQLYPVEKSEVGPVWSDAWKVSRRGGAPYTGVEVDMAHYLVETVDQTLRNVVEDCDPDPMKQLVVGGILHCIPLYGEELVGGWQRRAAYPEGLALAVVRANAQIEGLWRLDAYWERGNPVAGYDVLTAAHGRLLQTLLGLNRVYYAGFKSLTAVVGELSVMPQDLLARIRACYPLEARRSKALLTALVGETYDLIEERLPEIDVQRLREVLRYERPLWDGEE